MYAYYAFTLVLLISLTYPALNVNAQVTCTDFKANLTMEELDRDGIKYTKYKITPKLVELVFNVQYSEVTKVKYEFYLNGDRLPHVPSYEQGHIYYKLNSLSSKSLKLYLKDPSPRYLGTYKLVIRNEATDQEIKTGSCEFRTEKPLLDSSSETIRRTEGEAASFLCSSSSSNTLEVEWKIYRNNDWEPVPNAILSKNGEKITNGNLTIESVKPENEGHYLCRINNIANHAESVMFVLRVRNPKAVYWPLIGIGIEVLILLVTILVYEKKQYDKRKQEKQLNCKSPMADESAQPLMQQQTSENMNARV